MAITQFEIIQCRHLCDFLLVNNTNFHPIEYIPKTTQECTFWSCLQLTTAGAPG